MLEKVIPTAAEATEEHHRPLPYQNNWSKERLTYSIGIDAALILNERPE